MVCPVVWMECKCELGILHEEQALMCTCVGATLESSSLDSEPDYWVFPADGARCGIMDWILLLDMLLLLDK